ncbi:geraniol 8-hydroxylase [Prunus yedoensis var. nudiflora]|uniref:Geraniol 8-hydroxylase n=1 Tax=Prunus yedoensis var. nudiflora TaxID=2094558 RepID=A0A314ZCV2_PRUYE|nr:geraniol 8-hydroxylase [Prunus yedoensis var. nudiflora]
MAELLRNPESCQAQDELKQVIGKGKPVEESNITQAPLLTSHNQRDLPVAPSCPLSSPSRSPSRRRNLRLHCTKGCTSVGQRMGHRQRPQHWDNPTSFIPERFLGLDIDVTGWNFELILFGGGRRICPGLPLAMRMLNLMLGLLINSFDNWKLEDGVVLEKMNMEEKFGLTLQMSHPLIAVPIKY